MVALIRAPFQKEGHMQGTRYGEIKRRVPFSCVSWCSWSIPASVDRRWHYLSRGFLLNLKLCVIQEMTTVSLLFCMQCI